MKKKLIRITTISQSLRSLLQGQLAYLTQYYNIIGVAANRDVLRNVEEREGIQTHCIDMKRRISIFNDLKCLWKLYIFFRKEKPNIVHANTPKASLLSMIAAKVACVPHRIYTVTGLRFETTQGNFRRLLILMEKLTCACATKVIPEGEGVKKTLIKEKITKKPLQVIHNGNINGINTNYFSIRSIPANKNELRLQYGFEKEDVVFIFVGRIVRDKGINELITAFKTISSKQRNAKLLLVGSYEKELDPIDIESEREIDLNPNIVSVGFQNDVRPFFKMADALVFPSYREGFPNVVIQAGAMGLPSIVTDINGCNEIIIEGKNGLIIPSKNKTALEQAMNSFMIDSKLRQSLQLHARELICDRYEQKDVWKAILKMYQNLDKTI